MKNTKRVLLYDPYLDTIGGGEKHIFSIVDVFCEKGYSCDVVWENAQDLEKIKERFSLPLKNTTCIPNFIKKESALKRYKKTQEYDYFFYVTDGSYFFSGAKHNYVFAMVPQKDLFHITLINNLKLLNYSFITNSQFTKSFVDKWIGQQSTVIYPYIDDENFVSSKKERIILHVGRFFEHLHAKRQDIAIKAFQQFKKTTEGKGYTLHLVGGLDPKDREYMASLKKLAAGDSSIEFHPNASYKELKNMYKTARIYWHTAGYGIDDTRDPQLVEHLGITPLEAMASCCITFCYNGGGAKEYIKDSVNGFLYNTQEELIDKTCLALSKKDADALAMAGQDTASKLVSKEIFTKKINTFFNLV